MSKTETAYVDHSGLIRYIKDMPDNNLILPRTEWYHDPISYSDAMNAYDQSVREYEASLERAKQESILFEDQDAAKTLLWSCDERINNPIPLLFWWENMIKPDTFYSFEGDVEIIEEDTVEDGGGCFVAGSKTVARLSGLNLYKK